MIDNDELMHGLADGQLSDEEAARARELAENDPQSRRELSWATSIKQTLAKHATPVENREGWQAAVRRFDEMDRARGTERLVGKYAWAICCLFFVGIVFAGIGNRTLGSRTLSNTQVANILSVPNAERSATNTFDTDSIDLSRYRIVGVTEAVAEDNVPYVRLSLRDSLGGLVLIVTNGDKVVQGVDQPSSIRGFSQGQVDEANCVAWKANGHTFILASSRRPHAELLDHAIEIVNAD